MAMNDGGANLNVMTLLLAQPLQTVGFRMELNTDNVKVWTADKDKSLSLHIRVDGCRRLHRAYGGGRECHVQLAEYRSVTG